MTRKINGSLEFQPLTGSPINAAGILYYDAVGSQLQVSDGSSFSGVGGGGPDARGLTLTGLNVLRQLQNNTVTFGAGIIDGFGDAYIDSNGRLNSVNTIETSATFDVDKYKSTAYGDYYYIIEADDASVGWSSNDTSLSKISSGKWLLMYTGGGSEEVARAQLIKSLFWGTSTGNNSLILDFTNVTAVKTSHAGDVGKQAHYAVDSKLPDIPGNITYTGTFVNTSTNTEVSSWSYCKTTLSNSAVYARWEMPSGSTLNNRGPSQSGTIDETGQDKTADDKSNPATCQLDIGGGFNQTFALILCLGDITWVSSNGTYTSNIDFVTDHSIPLLTAADTLDNEGVFSFIEHNLPTGAFSSTISTVIGVPLIEDWEDGANIQYKLTNAGSDTGWIDAMNPSPELSEFTAFTGSPSILQVKLVPKTTSPTAGYPSINGFWIYSY